ncbi:MAG: recombinase family protein [Chloroflexi bacterium]|nr:recombinase family protein [Chloroflexota bacterium]
MACNPLVARKSSLSIYLHNPAFIGERVYNKQRHLETKSIRITREEEWVVVPEAHDATLLSELFDRLPQGKFPHKGRQAFR